MTKKTILNLSDQELYEMWLEGVKLSSNPEKMMNSFNIDTARKILFAENQIEENDYIGMMMYFEAENQFGEKIKELYNSGDEARIHNYKSAIDVFRKFGFTHIPNIMESCYEKVANC